MIYIPATILALARMEAAGAMIIHWPQLEKFQVTTCFQNAVKDSEFPEIICYGRDFKDENFLEGYAEMTHDLARSIADNSEEAEDADLFAAYHYFMSQESAMTQQFNKDNDQQEMRDYLYLLANGPVNA